MPDGLWYLKKCELLGRLSPDQIQQLESQSRVRTFLSRSPVYLPTETADRVFMLAEGLVKVCHLTSDGKESTLAFVEPGELFGELAIFDTGQRDEYVEAVEDSTVVMIPVQAIRQLIETRADMALAVTKMVGLRRHRIERRLKNLLFLSNRERLIHLLLDLVEQFGLAGPDGIRLTIKLSHQELANLIGSTRETVTVLLGQLKGERCVSGGRQQVILTDVERLAGEVGRRVPGCDVHPNMRLSPAYLPG